MYVSVHTGISGAVSWGWRGTALLENYVSDVLDVPAQAGGSESVLIVSRVRLFSPEAQQPLFS